jgi:hypothetical protein
MKHRWFLLTAVESVKAEKQTKEAICTIPVIESYNY